MRPTTVIPNLYYRLLSLNPGLDVRHLDEGDFMPATGGGDTSASDARKDRARKAGSAEVEPGSKTGQALDTSTAGDIGRDQEAREKEVKKGKEREGREKQTKSLLREIEATEKEHKERGGDVTHHGTTMQDLVTQLGAAHPDDTDAQDKLRNQYQISLGSLAASTALHSARETRLERLRNELAVSSTDDDATRSSVRDSQFLKTAEGAKVSKLPDKEAAAEQRARLTSREGILHTKARNRSPETGKDKIMSTAGAGTPEMGAGKIRSPLPPKDNYERYLKATQDDTDEPPRTPVTTRLPGVPKAAALDDETVQRQNNQFTKLIAGSISASPSVVSGATQKAKFFKKADPNNPKRNFSDMVSQYTQEHPDTVAARKKPNFVALARDTARSVRKFPPKPAPQS